MPQDIGVATQTFIPNLTTFLDDKDVNAYVQCHKRFEADDMTTMSASKPADSHSTLPSTFVPGFHDEACVRRLRYRSLGKTGMDVSTVAIGGGGLERFYGSLDEDSAINGIHLALRLGLNYIHTAPWYGAGKSEALLGKALQHVPRKAYFIGTKVGRYNVTGVENMFDFSAERVFSSVEESLHRLGLPSVDVIQVHDVEFAPNLDIILKETLPALEKLRKAGKCRFIGVTGYSVNMLLELVQKSTVKIDTILSYCRYGLYNNSLLEVLPELKKHGVGIINAAPLGLGLLSKQGPEDWHPANDSLKVACKAAVAYAQEHEVDMEKIILKFFYNSEDVDTTVASMLCVERPDLVSFNMNTFLEPMTEKERIVMEDVRGKFFRILDKTDWEGFPVARYWEAIREEEAARTGHLQCTNDEVMTNIPYAYSLFTDPPGAEMLCRKSTI